MTHRNVALVLHPDTHQVLLVAEGANWTLPRHTATDPSEISHTLFESLGLETIVQGPLYDRFDWLQDDQEAVYAVVAQTPVLLPDNARWFDRQALDQVALATPEHRTVLTAWLDELAAPHSSPETIPWMRPDWFSEARTWITTQLGAIGEELTGPIEQVRVGVTSCVLRVTTQRGTRFFKTTSFATHYEASLTAALAQRWPAQMPRVLAVDTARNWLLLDDLGATLRTIIGSQLDFDHYERLLRQYAELQRESAHEYEHLLNVGLPDRRLAHLPALFAAAVADPRGMLIDHPEGISHEAYQQLRDFTPQVEALCVQVAGYGLPDTLHHDDFHGGNIAVRDGTHTFFDWGESAFTHPLCSLLIVQRTAKYQYNADNAALDRLRDAYLEAWSDLVPLADLHELWPLARQLGALHRALSWHAAAIATPPALRPPLASAASYWFDTFKSNELP